jgi:hypothetical protein
MTRLRDLGLVPEKAEEAPIVALLNRISASTTTRSSPSRAR